MKRIPALICAACVGTLLSATAEAQEHYWLKDRKYAEGMGYRVGDFELHPGIGADFGYDSNYYLRHPDEDPIGSLRLRVSPSFALSTLGPQRRGEDAPPPSVNFYVGLSGTYHEFFPVSGSEAGQDSLQEQRNISAKLDTALDIAPQREWSGRVEGSISRTVQPTNEGDLNVSYDRWRPTAGTELIWTPGGGMLDWRLGYGFSGTFFEHGEFSMLDHYRNDIKTRGRWRFLPRTALMYEMVAGFITYPAGTLKTASYPLRSRIGLNGLITPAFGVTALVGWGSSFYAGDQEDFDSVLAQAELKWYLQPTPGTDELAITSSLSSLSVGFLRDFADSYIGTYLERDRGYGRFSYLFGGAFLLVVEAGVSAVVFPNNPVYGQPDGWTDVRVDSSLFAEYRVIDSVGININLFHDGYFSDTVLTFPNAAGFNPIAYQRFGAFLGGRWFM